MDEMKSNPQNKSTHSRLKVRAQQVIMPMSLFIRAHLGGAYDYQPLTTDTSFRLLKLLPDKWNATIQCELYHSAMDENPTYEALSYVWGNVNKSRKITLGSHVFKVTRNLEVALRHLRQEHQTRVLWVDAVCIDQKNIAERNQQVRMMWRIYQSAQTVLSWLGPSSSDSDASFSLVQEIDTLYQKMNLTAEDQSITPQSLLDLGFDAETKNWSALWSLFERPYWTRIWIIQELHFAGNTFDEDNDRCLIGCGNQWLRRKYFRETWQLMMVVESSVDAFWTDMEAFLSDSPGRKEPLRSFLLRNKTASIDVFDVLRLVHTRAPDQPQLNGLSTLMHATETFQATDPKDRVIALLGMLGDHGKQFTIDYSKSVDELLQDAVLFAIDQDQSLGILYGNRPQLDPGLCSWIPQCHTYYTSSPSWNSRVFNASGAYPAPKLSVDVNSGVLFVQGIIIGTVTNVIGPLGYPVVTTSSRHEKEEETIATWTALIDRWKAFDITRRQALWRTLVLDQENKDPKEPTSPAPEEFGEAFEMIFENKPVPKDYEPLLPDDERKFRYIRRVNLNMNMGCVYRCFLEMDSGEMGLGPFHLRQGDLVVVLLGGSLCFILRTKGEYFELVGDAYVHGVMKGERIRRAENGEILDTRYFGLC